MLPEWLFGRSGWGPADRFGLPNLVAATQLFPVSRAEGGGDADGERDGREQLRKQRLLPPEVFDSLPRGEAHFIRGRGVEMDPIKCRRDVLFNNATDAVSGSQIISVQTEPS